MSRSTNTTKQTVQLFWQHVRKYPKYFIPLIIMVPLNLLLGDYLTPYVTSEVLQKISQHAYDSQDLWGSFGGYILLFAFGAIASGIIGWRVAVWFVWKLEVHVIRDLADKTFNHLMMMSPNFHSNRFGGSLVSQANKLTGSYVRFIDSMVFSLYTLLIAIVATMAILAPRAPLYAAVLLTLSAIYITGTLYFSKPVREANTVEAEIQSAQTGALADSITNVMAVKSFSASMTESQRYHKATTKTLNAGLKSLYTTTKRESYASTITTGLNISALVVAIIAIGKFHADISTVFLIVTYTGGITSRLWDFQNVLRQYNRAMGDASDMVKILQIQPGIQDPENPEPLRIKNGSINFNHVEFTHDGKQKQDALFNDLDLHISNGEKIGLVGHSGSGKTTLTRLLLRFSDIDSGSITIDGQNIAAITQEDLRQSISYVPQEPLLFHRSIRENIAYGKPDATDDEIIDASRKAFAHDFIEKLPEGYETLVGERGVKLSGGQRQRIVIARAILKDAPILLLDEATSALDSESERLIQSALQTLMLKRTTIVIAHRLSTVQKMDRIIVLEEGEIVEHGSHKQLLESNGKYARLWAHQSGGFIEE